MSAQRVDAKVVLLGKESVGKTSLVERYVYNRFLVGPYQNTIGAAFVAKPIQVGDKVLTLGIWDTAGAERYEAMSRIYYRGARAAIVCYGKSHICSRRGLCCGAAPRQRSSAFFLEGCSPADLVSHCHSLHLTLMPVRCCQIAQFVDMQ
ncbi:hypothetical protein MATL_G00169840 [Megalops atlanticus]|uniref:Ras-related protein Rab-24 n=1 Tax=Megalops atlanticus TaxID=7932 RepID=A0A9D3T718_MEGAT|nr:hypothetical protein MATL_G00169840 [Megalops atlanticus]